MGDISKIVAIDQNELENLFSQYPVIVAYLYGSVARNESGPLSDVDMAILLEDTLSKQERFDLRLRLTVELVSRLKMSQVDLIVLNDAPVYLQFEVIKANQVLYCRDEIARIRYEAKTMSFYLDRKYYDERHSQILLEQIISEGLR